MQKKKCQAVFFIFLPAALTCTKNITTLIGMNEYVILLAWDDEASVWTAVNDDIPIALESESLDMLIERVKMAAPELLEINKRNHTNITLHFSMEYEKVVA
jgi:hypothetical protein